MKIIILGAGQVGMTVAMHLVGENDITVVDREPQLLKDLQDRLDLRTVQGYGAHPDILRLAGAEDADMLLAVTNNDETNMVACQVAWTLFRTPKKIARVRALSFTRHPELFRPDALPIDVVISPEQLVTDYIARLIEYPGALQVLDFADGKVRLVAMRAVRGGSLVGNELKTIYRHIPDIDARVAAIYRQGRPIHPEGTTVIEEGDEVFFIAAVRDIPKVMGVLREAERPYRKLIFAGGGNIGRRLSLMLQGSHRIKLIERDPEASERLARELNRTIILTGNAADQNLLLEENIENTDVFCAITNDEEANILSAMLAKRLGARKVMALINRASYVDLVENSPIDIAISPQQATIGELLTHIRKGDVKKVHSLRRGAAEAMEAIAHGTPETSKVVGRCIDEIKLPPGTMIGAVVRGEAVIMAHHDTLVESGDHVILFLVDKRAVRDVERLFQVGVTFL